MIYNPTFSFTRFDMGSHLDYCLCLMDKFVFTLLNTFFYDPGEGSIFNFNKQAYETLDAFETIAKEQLKTSAVAHADETGIHKCCDRFWLHCVSNNSWTLYPSVA